MRLIRLAEASEFYLLLRHIADHEDRYVSCVALANWMAYSHGTIPEIKAVMSRTPGFRHYNIPDTVELFEKALNFFEQVRAQRSEATCPK